MARQEFKLARSLRLAEAISAEVSQLARSVSDAQFHAPAHAGGWSIGHCLEHLVLSGSALSHYWDRAIVTGSGPSAGGGDQFPYTWWEQIVLRWLQNPQRFRRKTSQALAPQGRYSVPESMARFTAMQRSMTRRLEAAQDLDLRKTTMRIPFLPIPRVSLGFAFDAALAHERRHLEQAWRVRQQLARGHSG